MVLQGSLQIPHSGAAENYGISALVNKGLTDHFRTRQAGLFILQFQHAQVERFVTSQVSGQAKLLDILYVALHGFFNNGNDTKFPMC